MVVQVFLVWPGYPFPITHMHLHSNRLSFIHTTPPQNYIWYYILRYFTIALIPSWLFFSATWRFFPPISSYTFINKDPVFLSLFWLGYFFGCVFSVSPCLFEFVFFRYLIFCLPFSHLAPRIHHLFVCFMSYFCFCICICLISYTIYISQLNLLLMNVCFPTTAHNFIRGMCSYTPPLSANLFPHGFNGYNIWCISTPHTDPHAHTRTLTHTHTHTHTSAYLRPSLLSTPASPLSCTFCPRFRFHPWHSVWTMLFLSCVRRFYFYTSHPFPVFVTCFRSGWGLFPIGWFVYSPCPTFWIAPLPYEFVSLFSYVNWFLGICRVPPIYEFFLPHGFFAPQGL